MEGRLWSTTIIINDVKLIGRLILPHLGRLPLLAAMMGLGACGGQNGERPAPPPKPVTVAVAEARDVPLYLDEIGSCEAIESVSVRPQVSGRLTDVHFEDGAFVKKGDLLFTIDPQPFQAALDRAQATLAQDEAKLVFARKEFTRQEELRKTKVIAAQDLDSSESNSAAAMAQVAADRAAVESAKIDLDYTRITSPIDGKAGQRLIDPGNIVSANSTDLVVVKLQNPLHVEFTIAEDSLPRVRTFYEKEGLSAEAWVPADPGEKRKGVIDFLDNAVQSSTGTVTLRAVMPNDDNFFWPGQFVKVRLLLDELKDAVLVPAESLQVGQKGPFLFVVKDDSTVELRPVQPGQPQGDDLVISGGLEAGEKVVVTGQLSLAPGAKVAVQPDAAETAEQAP